MTCLNSEDLPEKVDLQSNPLHPEISSSPTPALLEGNQAKLVRSSPPYDCLKPGKKIGSLWFRLNSYLTVLVLSEPISHPGLEYSVSPIQSDHKPLIWVCVTVTMAYHVTWASGHIVLNCNHNHITIHDFCQVWMVETWKQKPGYQWTAKCVLIQKYGLKPLTSLTWGYSPLKQLIIYF